jgi:hypothetical protein
VTIWNNETSKKRSIFTKLQAHRNLNQEVIDFPGLFFEKEKNIKF